MGYKGLKFGTFLTVVVVIAAIYYRKIDDNLQNRLIAVQHGLEKLETRHPISARPKVAIGYGACTDVFVDAKNLLNYSEDVGQPRHFDEIKTEDELLMSFAYYFRHGAAAELVLFILVFFFQSSQLQSFDVFLLVFRRYMTNEKLFEELVSRARASPSSYSSIGGNAPVMALRFAQEGCDVVLAAKMTKSLRRMIPESVKVVGGKVEHDDIHLILEYKHGESWGPYTSARANRYRIHLFYTFRVVIVILLFI